MILRRYEQVEYVVNDRFEIPEEIMKMTRNEIHAACKNKKRRRAQASGQAGKFIMWN